MDISTPELETLLANYLRVAWHAGKHGDSYSVWKEAAELAMQLEAMS